jgi:hypothetical protein
MVFGVALPALWGNDFPIYGQNTGVVLLPFRSAKAFTTIFVYNQTNGPSVSALITDTLIGDQTICITIRNGLENPAANSCALIKAHHTPALEITADTVFE